MTQRQVHLAGALHETICWTQDARLLGNLYGLGIFLGLVAVDPRTTHQTVV